MSNDAIVASFVQSGEFTLLSDPNSYFWLVPYFSLALGVGVVVWMVLAAAAWQRVSPHPMRIQSRRAGGPGVESLTTMPLLRRHTSRRHRERY